MKAFLFFPQIPGKKEIRKIKLYWLGNDKNSAAQNCAFLSFSSHFFQADEQRVASAKQCQDFCQAAIKSW